MDAAQFTAKERKQARKSLLKKIDGYNKQARKSRTSSGSFLMTSPSKDLVYKGIVKVTYDRGYALQTKSLLLENTTTAADAVVQLFDALGLRGKPTDYALEEHNIMTGEIRMIGPIETPLNLQLDYGSHKSYMELQLVQLRDTLAAPLPSAAKSHRANRAGRGDGDSDSDETLSNSSSPNDIVPKEEVIDHGIASVEIVMEEALQDIPTIVFDIQERLKRLSESVAVDGKPRHGLPNRRLLWDVLKPQASTLVKDIRRLVDNGEFLSSKHARSPVVKLMVTLLLELITDHSRELVTVTKEMCALKGAAKTDFDSSISLFTQQITYISKLVGKANETLHAMALVGHLLEATNPDSLQSGKLTGESYFIGSGSVSGVLLFTVVSAHLGLVRAAYEEKHDFYASLATNMLRSSQRALETIQKTDEYGMLHLHPLRSRVRDMEHKLKVAMDNLIRGVKLASSPRSPPDTGPELLLSGHALIMATLDFLMVAQCASLVHKVVIAGWELLQFPWVRAIADGSSEGKTDSAAAPSFSEQLSSLGSDSTSSQSTSTGTDSGVYQRSAIVERMVGERRSRIHGPSHFRESGDGMDAAELAASEQKKKSIGKLGMMPKHLLPFYQREVPDSGEEADDERGIHSFTTATSVSPSATPMARSDTEEDIESDVITDIGSYQSATVSTSTQPSKKKGPSNFELESSHYMGIDAVKKLRMHYNVNKTIAKCAESLLLSVTQKINILTIDCQKRAKEKYTNAVELILGAASQIREEVSAMEVDILVSENTTELLERTRPEMESVVHEVHMATISASNPSAPENAEMKILSAVRHLKDICSKTVAEALSKVREHKKAVEQAEKIEQEFVSLMTGQNRSRTEKHEATANVSRMSRHSSSPAILFAHGEAEIAGIVYEGTGKASGPLASGVRGWAAKETPRIIGGTLEQLIQRLTYHRVIDPEFTKTFFLSFHSFMAPEKLIDALITRYNVEPTEEMSDSDLEAFEINIVIPIRLRVINAVRMWLNLSYNDFKEERMQRKLQVFIKLVKETMPSCAKQLANSADVDARYAAPLKNSRRQAPTPLAPMTLSQGDNFDLLDVNTLELARQLTLAFSKVLRGIQPQELLSFAWRDKSKHGLVPHIMAFLHISANLTELVQREVLRESAVEDQTSVLSYFIQTAKSCLDLKNYEAVFSIVAGLESDSIQSVVDSWQLVTEKLKSTYKELKELVSPEMNYQRYRQELQAVHQTPCVPRLHLVVLGMEEVHKNHSDFLPDTKDIINFGKRREYAKVIQELQRSQTYTYNLCPVEIMQQYLENLKRVLTEEEFERLSTKVEAFSI